MSATESNVTGKKYSSGPLAITYPTYKDMNDNNIIFGYRGIVTSDLVTNVLDIMGERLEGDGQSKKLSKKVFNVMVECLTNAYVDENGNPGIPEGYDPSALLLVKKIAKSYRVTTGNLVQTQDVKKLKKMIDEINEMSYDELKAHYQQMLASEENNTIGLTNLGIIDLARKSKNRLVYNFKFESERYTLFTLELEISGKSL